METIKFNKFMYISGDCIFRILFFYALHKGISICNTHVYNFYLEKKL